MMVSAPDVDQMIEPAHLLVVVISHIRHEVGHLAVGLDHDAVFLIPQSRGAEPDGTVFLFDVALVFHGLEGTRNRAFPHFVFHIEAALREPLIEGGAQLRQDVFLIFLHLLVGYLTESHHALFVSETFVLGAFGIYDGLGDIRHVAPTVALLGHLGVMTEQLHIANTHGIAEDIHLGTVVIDVELLVNIIARMTHHARHGIT